MRDKLFLGAIVALLLAVASVPLAFAGGGSGSDDDDDVRIFQLTLRHGPFTELDHGASGPGVGDRFIFFGDVIRNGEQVGAGGGECVTLLFRLGARSGGRAGSPHRPVRRDRVAAAGPDHGARAGRPDGPRAAQPPITGGTGAYRTAHGELQTEGPDEMGDERITAKLILGDDD